MQQRRYLNPSQPQTLQIAVMLFYFTAALQLFQMIILFTFPVDVVIVSACMVAAAYGIANERKWAYILGIVVAVAPFVLRFLLDGNPFEGWNLIGLMFQIALVALLVHPQSRDYQRIWFK